jgi:hypothetical protein
MPHQPASPGGGHGAEQHPLTVALAGRGQPGRLALCLQRPAEDSSAVAVLNDWINAALTLGASLQDPARQESFGAEAWLLDPEGNRLLLFVLPSSMSEAERHPSPLGTHGHATPWRDEPVVTALFRDAGVDGTFVLLDEGRGELRGHNRERAEQRFSPASTFRGGLSHNHLAWSRPKCCVTSHNR